EAASLFYEAIQLILSTVEDLQEDDLLRTPFSNNKTKESEAVIQQSFWLFTGALTGSTYKKQEFENQTFEQFENQTSRKISTLSSEERNQLNEGVTDFWNTFEAVGVEAKVIRRNPDNPILQQFSSD